MERVLSGDGTALACRVTGTGPAIVLVHGTGGDHTRWDLLVPHLAPAATVVAMDRRGRGGSTDVAPYSLEKEAQDVADVVRWAATRHGRPVALFGHSFGALVALEALRRGAPADAAILYEPVLLNNGPTGFADKADALLARAGRPAVVEAFLRDVLEMTDAEVEAARHDPSWAMRVACADTIAREDRAEGAYRFDPKAAARIQLPVLLLQGGRSPTYIAASSEALAKVLPNRDIVRFDAQGHAAIRTAPALVAAAVTAFLADVARKPAGTSPVPAPRGTPGTNAGRPP